MRKDGEVNKLQTGDPCRLQTNGPFSSLNEAWFHVLDRCVISLLLSEAILRLMRDCFFAGATYAVLLLQKGHGDEFNSRHCRIFKRRAAARASPGPLT